MGVAVSQHSAAVVEVYARWFSLMRAHALHMQLRSEHYKCTPADQQRNRFCCEKRTLQRLGKECSTDSAAVRIARQNR